LLLDESFSTLGYAHDGEMNFDSVVLATLKFDEHGQVPCKAPPSRVDTVDNISKAPKRLSLHEMLMLALFGLNPVSAVQGLMVQLIRIGPV